MQRRQGGNHIFVWTGLLEYTPSEDELATVLAHEIAHVIAGHTDSDPAIETRKILIRIGAIAAGMAAGIATGGAEAGSVADLVAGMTSSVGEGLFVNPWSQEKELEADQVGLFLMAEAGYNPQHAIDFWLKFQKEANTLGPLQFLSTHPPAKERIEQLRKIFPLAQRRYQQAIRAELYRQK